jgi:acyl carrier protein
VDLEPRVTAVIARELHLDPQVLKPESTFEELGLDSLAGVAVLFALEEEFHIDIPDAVVREARSIGQVVDLLSRSLAGKGLGIPNASAHGAAPAVPE